jgi:hypothetical protein
MKYEVTFKCELLHTIEVEAEDVHAAIGLAQREMNEVESHHLPEVWGMDFSFDSVEALS